MDVIRILFWSIFVVKTGIALFFAIKMWRLYRFDYWRFAIIFLLLVMTVSDLVYPVVSGFAHADRKTMLLSWSIFGVDLVVRVSVYLPLIFAAGFDRMDAIMITGVVAMPTTIAYISLIWRSLFARVSRGECRL